MESRVFKVIIKQKEWSIPLSKIGNIGLLDDIYKQTNEIEIFLDMIDSNVFSLLYEMLINGISNQCETTMLIKLIKLGDYLMCDSLVKELCSILSIRMEVMTEEELKKVYDEWE